MFSDELFNCKLYKMKTNFLIARVITTLFSVALVFNSCKKETSESNLSPQEEEQASVASSESEAESESIFNEVFDNVIGVNNDVGLAGTGVFGRMSTSTTTNQTERIAACFNVSITHVTQGQDFPLRVEIDFGTGCTGRDGRVRSGKIITEYTGRLMVPGKSATTVFKEYKVDGVTVEGSLKITNTGNANTRQFTVEVTNAKLTNPNGNYTKWNSKRVITQVEGLGTPDLHMDDIFTITGGAYGEVRTSTFATTWESSIVEPLYKRFGCPYISKGKVKIIRRNLSADSKWIGILNYGTGTCDNKATLTVNGAERQIILH
jgi:hypothetical protein